MQFHSTCVHPPSLRNSRNDWLHPNGFLSKHLYSLKPPIHGQFLTIVFITETFFSEAQRTRCGLCTIASQKCVGSGRFLFAKHSQRSHFEPAQMWLVGAFGDSMPVVGRTKWKFVCCLERRRSHTTSYVDDTLTLISFWFINKSFPGHICQISPQSEGSQHPTPKVLERSHQYRCKQIFLQ